MYKSALTQFIEWHKQNSLYVPKNPSIEHVVPRSVISKFVKVPHSRKKRLESDMHNFIILPTKLNQCRGHLPFSENISENSIAYCQYTGERTTKKGLRTCYCHEKVSFTPCENLRGRIARCVCHMMLSNPDNVFLIDREVLSYATLMRWLHDYPPNEIDYSLNEFIYDVQGVKNLSFG